MKQKNNLLEKKKMGKMHNITSSRIDKTMRAQEDIKNKMLYINRERKNK